MPDGVKFRVDAIVPDPAIDGSFIVNGSVCLPDEHGLVVGHTYSVTFGADAADALPTPEPGTEADPPPLPPESNAQPTA